MTELKKKWSILLFCLQQELQATGLDYCFHIITRNRRTQEYYQLFKLPLNTARIKVSEALIDGNSPLQKIKSPAKPQILLKNAAQFCRNFLVLLFDNIIIYPLVLFSHCVDFLVALSHSDLLAAMKYFENLLLLQILLCDFIWAHIIVMYRNGKWKYFTCHILTSKVSKSDI